MEICKHYIEDLEVGMFAEKSFYVTEEDVRGFAKISGDFNPLHLDQKYAEKTIFKDRVAHGALIAAYISSVLGNDLPGPGAIFIDMNIRFRRPVYFNETIRSRVEVAEINPRYERVLMKVVAYVGTRKVVSGTTTVRIPKRGKKTTHTEKKKQHDTKNNASDHKNLVSECHLKKMI